MAEIAGVTKHCIKGVVAALHPAAGMGAQQPGVVDGAPSAQQLAAAQKATRPAKPESKSWAELKATGAPMRAVWTRPRRAS